MPVLSLFSHWVHLQHNVCFLHTTIPLPVTSAIYISSCYPLFPCWHSRLQGASTVFTYFCMSHNWYACNNYFTAQLARKRKWNPLLIWRQEYCVSAKNQFRTLKKSQISQEKINVGIFILLSTFMDQNRCLLREDKIDVDHSMEKQESGKVHLVFILLVKFPKASRIIIINS